MAEVVATTDPSTGFVLPSGWGTFTAALSTKLGAEVLLLSWTCTGGPVLRMTGADTEV